jgi:hypothetical protein
MKIQLCAALTAALAASAAYADTFSFATPTGATVTSGAVNDMATITTGAGTVSITLNDLLANPKDVGELLSDIQFTLSNGATVGTLASSSGTTISVNGDGTTTAGSTGSTGWGIKDNVGGGIELDDLGFGGPADLIIGPPGPGGVYTNANGSIAGNPAHNPFLSQSATFTINVTGVTASTTITSATFSFGTTEGAEITPGVPTLFSSVPEPSSVLLLASVICGVFVSLRKRFASR